MHPWDDTQHLKKLLTLDWSEVSEPSVCLEKKFWLQDTLWDEL